MANSQPLTSLPPSPTTLLCPPSKALFRERPELYDVLLELEPDGRGSSSPSSTPAAGEHAPSKGRLTFSIHTPASLADGPGQPRASGQSQRMMKTTTSALGPTWWDGPLLAALASAGASSHQEPSPRGSASSWPLPKDPSANASAAAWLAALVAGCDWCLSLLLGRSGAGADGGVYLPLSQDDDDDAGGGMSANEDESDVDLPASLQPAQAILTLILHSHRHLSSHLASLLPPPSYPSFSSSQSSPTAPERLLSALELARLGLSPFASVADRTLVRALSGGRLDVGGRWI